jgi:hypothetical protein
MRPHLPLVETLFTRRGQVNHVLVDELAVELISPDEVQRAGICSKTHPLVFLEYSVQDGGVFGTETDVATRHLDISV